MKGHVFAGFAAFTVFTILAAIAVADIYEAPRASAPPTIDGNLGEWAGVPGLHLGGDTWEANGGSWDNDADLHMTLMVMWDDDNLYIASLVKDEAHINTQTGASIWNGDCVQYMVDPTGNRTDTTNVVYEFGYALAGANSNELMSTRWLQNSSAPATFQSDFAVVRNNGAGTTTYEVCLPKVQISPAELTEGNILGFGAIANDGDPGALGQAGWVGWGSGGIVFGKNAAELQELLLSGEPSAAQPSGKLSTTWGGIKH